MAARQTGLLLGIALGMGCGESTPSGSLTLELANTTFDTPLFIQVEVRNEPAIWIGGTAPDGSPIVLNPECGEACGQESTPCPSEQPNDRVERIAPGESKSFSWDGYYYLRDEEEACLEKHAADSGTFLFALCYGTKPVLTSGGERAAYERCAIVEATPGEESVVRHEVGAVPPDQHPAARAVLVAANTSSVTVYLQEASDCDPSNRWYSVQPVSAGDLVPTSRCSCLCALADRGLDCVDPTCGQAGLVAPPDCGTQPATVRTLAPGEVGSVDFEGTGFRARAGSGFSGESCLEEVSGNGTLFSANFCWGTEFFGDDFFMSVLNPTCSGALEFTLATSPVEVRHEIQ